MSATIRWAGGNVTGGAVVTDGVVSWIPACSVVQYGSISFERSQGFDLTTTDYITDVSEHLSTAAMDICCYGGALAVELAHARRSHA